MRYLTTLLEKFKNAITPQKAGPSKDDPCFGHFRIAQIHTINKRNALVPPTKEVDKRFPLSRRLLFVGEAISERSWKQATIFLLIMRRVYDELFLAT